MKEKRCKCGGRLAPEEDRLVCENCGRPVYSKALRHKYLERNKDAIMRDLDALTRPQVLKKWRIPSSTMPGLLKRWGYKKGAAPPACLSAFLSPRFQMNGIFIVSGLSDGERIRLARLQRYLRQVDVASLAGVSLSEVTNAEKDRYVTPERKARILKLLGLDGEEPDGTPDT